MKKGSLVNWHTEAWVFKDAIKDYKNPGIVLAVREIPLKSGGLCAEVMWADGKITSEHACYLQLSGE